MPAGSQFRIPLDLHRECTVLVEPAALDRLPEVLPARCGRSFLVSDRRVMALYGGIVTSVLARSRVEAVPLSVKPGERSKSPATWSRLERAMLREGVNRDTLVVALGGGVTTDLAGFVASTVMRGLPLLHLPTTLIAVVDAAIGGKNGINTPAGKNLLGTFHWPVAVVADTDLLRTLPAREIRSGLAEMVKHGVIRDPGLFDDIERATPALVEGALPRMDLILRALRVKSDVAAADPFETGLRRILNFGHTVGHAIEAATSGYTHGEAVSIGMVVESRVACRLTGLSAADAGRLRRLLETLGLPTRPPCAVDRVVPFLGMDKKSARDRVRMALPRSPGDMEEAGGRYAVEVPLELLEECWDGP